MEVGVQKAVAIISKAKHCIAFTGAGVSVESGIPPFRGAGGIWNKYNPQLLEIDFYKAHPEQSWPIIHELFFTFLDKIQPNAGHIALAQMERAGIIKNLITQNIDGLHSKAGSKRVIEFHGSCMNLICTRCERKYNREEILINTLPPRCPQCEGLLKPDFIFFGEAIPDQASHEAFNEASQCDVMLVIGTTGEVMPAALLPKTAQQHGATIIEINMDKASVDCRSQDVFLKGKAGVIMPQIINELNLPI